MKAEIVNYYYQWQILNPIGKRKAKRSFTVSVKTPNGTENKATLRDTTRINEIKMNRRAFASINRMRAGHTSLEASLNRFNIVSKAECECGDGFQTEEHIFWDYKLYEDQRATMMDILSENRKKIPTLSYRALTARGKKIRARCLLLDKQNSNIYFKIKLDM
jgi:hypothetical protein